MNREPYWDYMRRRLREQHAETDAISREDLCKREIAEMQKTVQWCFVRIRELNDEIHDLKSQLKQHIADSDNRQIKMDF